MDYLLRGYSVNQATWFYLSSILIIAVFFRFTRVFSLRNLDLLLLLSASPGLIFVGSPDPQMQAYGHGWLMVIGCLFLVRLFIDPLLNRRPYLGQNLNPQGLGFLCIAAFAFLMTQAITDSVPESSTETLRAANSLVTRTAVAPAEAAENGATVGPAGPILSAPALVFEDLAARILAIFAHGAVITGLWFAGRNLFADKSLGLAMATLYLLIPCTAYEVGQFNHALPAALIVWAFVCFRKPIVAGVLLGLASGTLFFPLFLLPIWAAFYGRQRAGRFILALGCVAIVLLGSLALTSTDSNSFVQKTLGTINSPLAAVAGVETHQGFWGDVGYLSVYRLPVIVGYAIMLIVMTIWPRQRTVETLLAQSTAAIVGIQLWYTPEGGVYLLWDLPLMLMVIFRPRLLHLASWRKPPETNEQTSITPAKSSPPASLLNRPIASRSLQLFR